MAAHEPIQDDTERANNIKENVRNRYGKLAFEHTQKKESGIAKSCCGVSTETDIQYLQQLGYSKEEIESSPEGANLGLGCGNPQVFAQLKPSEIVLDLGSGAGFDCFCPA